MLFPFHDNNPTHRFPAVTVGLVAVNLLVWVWLWLQPPLRETEVIYRRGFIPARVLTLPRGQAIEIRVPVPMEETGTGVPVDELGRPVPAETRVLAVQLEASSWQVAASLFTSMFLHAGWAHVLGNMWFLWLFGNNVEDRLGPVVYLLFYVGGGLVAVFCHWLTNPSDVTPVVGASGAVSAVLGAYAVSWPKARIRTVLFLGIIMVIELPALAVLGFWMLQQLLEAVNAINLNLSGGVAWWAHIGGFVAGAAAMPLLKLVVPPPPEKPPVLEYPPPDREFGGRQWREDR
jgi:membrane associated rhomboid family serine protease